MSTETQRLQVRLLEQYSTTSSIFKDIKARYAKLRNPENLIGREDIALLTDRMLPIIARPTDIDPKSLTNQIVYVASRVPKEIFSPDADVQIRFNDDPKFFLDHKGIDGKPDAKTAPDRKRLYVVDEVESPHNPKKRIVTIHAQSQTAVVETMVHASVIESLRSYLTRLVNHDITTHDRHLFERRTRLIRNLMTLFVDNPDTVTNELSEWLKRKMEFSGSDGLPEWEDLKESSKTAKVLAQVTREALEGQNLPTGIMFANNYSLPNILSHGLLNKEAGATTRRNAIISDALEAREIYEQSGDTAHYPLISLGQSLAKMGIKNDQDYKGMDSKTQFRIDNLIIFHLTRKNGQYWTYRSKTIDDFIEEFNAPDRLSRLGIRRLVESHNSPTADAVDYIDFSRIPDETIDTLNPLIKSAVAKLKKRHYSTLCMPYAPGDLTFSIITEMKKAIPSIGDVMEIGKVAHYVSGFTNRKFSDIGHLVLPKYTFDITHPSAPNAYANGVELKHLEAFDNDDRMAYETALIQFPSVILQEADDIEEYLVRTFGEKLDKQHFTINMEVGSFREAVERSHHGLRLFEADYISDHAISQKTIDTYKSFGRENVFKQITKKLEEEGVQGVHATTAAVILALSQAR